MTNYKEMAAHEHEYGHGTLKSYIIGFILSILLTVIPYFIVVNHVFTSGIIIAAVVLLAVLQLLVQLVFFLHLNTESKPRWNLTAFVFSALIVAILVAGTMWIMYHLDYNMSH